MEWVLGFKLMQGFVKIHTYTMSTEIFSKTLKGRFYVLLGYQTSDIRMEDNLGKINQCN